MRFLEAELRKRPGADIRFSHEVTGRLPGREIRDRDGTDTVGPVSVTGCYAIRGRRCAQRGAPLARRRIRRLHLPRAVLIASTDFRFEKS